MKKSRTKKLFASLPMIGLILGAVAIATEFRRPMPLDIDSSVDIPHCKKISITHHLPSSSSLSTDGPSLCAQ